MAAREIVDYIIGMGGNLQQQATAATGAVDRLGASARSTAQSIGGALADSAKKVQRSSLVSEFETLASVLTQVGGNVSRVGTVTASLARPVAILAGAVGGTALAATGAAAAFGLLSLGLIKGVSAAYSYTNSMIATAEELKKLKAITSEQTRDLDQLSISAHNLDVELKKLKVGVAEDMAGGFDKMNEAMTGSVRLMNDIRSGASDAWTELARFIAELDKVGNKGAIDTGIRLLTERGQGAPDYAGIYGPQLPTNYDAEQLERMRALGAGPEYDPIAVGNLRRQQAAAAERAQAKKERALNDEIQAALQADQIWSEVYQRHVDAGLMMTALAQDLEREAAAAAQAEQDALDAFDARNRAQRESMFSSVASAASGGGIGALASVAATGPAGVIVGLLAGIEDLGGQIEDLFDQVLDLYTDLPRHLGKIVGEVVPDLIRQAPEMAAAFMVLTPAIALELVKAAPELLDAVVDAVLSLPEAFARAIVDALSFQIGGREVGLGNVDPGSRGAQIAGGAIAGAFLGGPVGAVAGAALGAYTGRKGGGNSKASRSRQSGGGVYIGQVVAPNPREHVRQLRQIQGSYGYGYDLDPVVA